MSFLVICVSPTDYTPAFRTGLEKVFANHKLSIAFAQKKQTLRGELRGEPSIEVLNQDLVNLSQLHRVDIALIPKTIFEAPKKLAVFDMDSTLITAEVIDEMALRHGVGEKVKLITARAMNGELDFNQSLTERVGLLKGFHRRHMQEIVSELTFTPGTPEFLKVLRSKGIKTAIASGGFEYFARSVQSRLEMDEVFANNLEFEGDYLTGRIQGEIVNAERKARIIDELADKYKISPQEVIAIGDGANDIPMLLKAGTGIAVHAKEKVQRSVRLRINYGAMTAALSYLNLED